MNKGIVKFYNQHGEGVVFIDKKPFYVYGAIYDQDLNELQKLKIIKVETEYIRISNYISNSILRKCQEELIESEEIPRNLFDMTLFKKIMEFGLMEQA